MVVAMFFVVRVFVSDLDLSFAWTPVVFDVHLPPGALIDAVNCFSALAAATCYQHAGSDQTEHNDSND